MSRYVDTLQTHKLVTPSKGFHAKMTTPPDSYKESPFDPQIAPQKYTPTAALLSPAFSSPNRVQDGMDYSSPPCIDPSSSLSFDKPKKKKKTKKEMKESSFDLNSDDKPPYSYATLIGISILSHEDKRLSLSQIYSWISDTFRYYKKEDVGWQNSIRHNLSLNKAFVKGEKSKDGKGHFWCIKPGYEDQFLKSRSVKKSSYYEVMDQISNNRKRKEQEKEKKMPSSPTTTKQEEDQSFSYTYDEPAPKRHKPETKPEMQLGAPFTNTPKLEPSSQPSVMVDSPKPSLGKNHYTSSFSCKSNLELSPVRPSETGPLLEPLTPANNNILLASHQIPQNLNSHLYSIINQNLLKPDKATIRTPKSNAVRTPLRNLKTPQSSSVTKKLWNSPSYLDDFYYSPLVSSVPNHILTSYDDDDMVMRSFENHPQQQSPTRRLERADSTLTEKDEPAR